MSILGIVNTGYPTFVYFKGFIAFSFFCVDKPESGPADPNQVFVRQSLTRDDLIVDIGVVRTSQVSDEISTVVRLFRVCDGFHNGMFQADNFVVNEDFTVRVAADADDRFIKGKFGDDHSVMQLNHR